MYADEEDDASQVSNEPLVESISDIEDEEIDHLIAGEAEIKMNEIIWDSMFKDWEEEQKGIYIEFIHIH